MSQNQASQPAEENAAVSPENSELSAAAAPSPATKEDPQRGTTLFWRIFSGAAVGIVALVCGMVYQQMQGQVNHLRNELGRLSTDLHDELVQLGTASGTMIKKGEHDSKIMKVWDTLKELRADRSDLTVLKERCAGLVEASKTAEADRRQLALEVARLREHRAAEDEKRALTSEIRALRLRISELEAPSGKQRVLPAGHVEEHKNP